MPYIDEKGNIRSINREIIIPADEYKKMCEEQDTCHCEVPDIHHQFGYEICANCGCRKFKEQS